jgi:hypothetical protein
MRIGFRRDELSLLRSQDFHVDGPQPFICARASTTKNHKAAAIPIEGELAEAWRDSRPIFALPD